MNYLFESIISVPLMFFLILLGWASTFAMWVISLDSIFIWVGGAVLCLAYVLMVILTYKELQEEDEGAVKSLGLAILSTIRHWVRALVIPVVFTQSPFAQIKNISSKTLDDDKDDYL